MIQGKKDLSLYCPIFFWETKLNFYYQNQQQNLNKFMIKVNKHVRRGKAISSYFLSGINIKKMISDELQTSLNNLSNAGIVQVNKRPIFKIKSKQSEKQNAINQASNLPNKSFKIRSFTKKLRDQSAIKLVEGDDIFDKIQNVRNFKSNSNRVELFSRIKDRQQPQYVAGKTATKMKEILRVQASLKCKMSSQIFIRQTLIPPNYEHVTIEFDKFDTERYSELANKINVNFNDSYKEDDSTNKLLLIVSMDVLKTSHRKQCKTIFQEDRSQAPRNPQKCQKLKALQANNQQVELIRLLTSRSHGKYQTNMRLVFKVESQSELQQLKIILQHHKIDRYYSIFYPIKKYSENLSLYHIDPLLKNCKQILIIEEKYKINQQFPVVGADYQVAFISTNNQSIFSINRVINAVKNMNFRQNKKAQCFSPLVQDLEQANGSQNQEVRNVTTIRQQRRKVHLHQDSQIFTQQSKSYPQLPRLQIKSQYIQFPFKQLDAKLKFIEESKKIKSFLRKDKEIQQKEGAFKRRVLRQQQYNTVTQPYIIIDKVINLYRDSNYLVKIQENKVKKLQQIQQNIISLVSREAKNNSHVVYSQKNHKRMQAWQKDDVVQQICGYLKGCLPKIKTNSQAITDTIKKNHHIYNQISQYHQKIRPLQKHMASNFKKSQLNKPTQNTLMKVYNFV